MEAGYSGRWCVCVYVDSHLRYHINLTGFVREGDGGGWHVCM